MRLQLACITRRNTVIISSRFSTEELKEIFLFGNEDDIIKREFSLSVEEDELFKPETDWKIRDPELAKEWVDRLNFWKANHVFVGATMAEIEGVVKNNPADYYYFKDCHDIDLNYKNMMIHSIEDCTIKTLNVAKVVSIRGNTKIDKIGENVNIRAISENTTINKIEGRGDIEVICGDAVIENSSGSILIHQIYGNAVIKEFCNGFILIKGGNSKVEKLIGGAEIRIGG